MALGGLTRTLRRVALVVARLVVSALRAVSSYLGAVYHEWHLYLVRDDPFQRSCGQLLLRSKALIATLLGLVGYAAYAHLCARVASENQEMYVACLSALHANPKHCGWKTERDFGAVDPLRWMPGTVDRVVCLRNPRMLLGNPRHTMVELGYGASNAKPVYELPSASYESRNYACPSRGPLWLNEDKEFTRRAGRFETYRVSGIDPWGEPSSMVLYHPASAMCYQMLTASDPRACCTEFAGEDAEKHAECLAKGRGVLTFD